MQADNPCVVVYFLLSIYLEHIVTFLDRKLVAVYMAYEIWNMSSTIYACEKYCGRFYSIEFTGSSLIALSNYHYETAQTEKDREILRIIGWLYYYMFPLTSTNSAEKQLTHNMF